MKEGRVMTMTQSDQWVPLTQAARELGVSAGKLSQMAKKGRFETRKNPKDERITLVNMKELRKLFEQ